MGTSDRRVPDDWPFADASERVSAGAVHWHVQRPGTAGHGAGAPRLLCLHGTGASAHSFRGLAHALRASADLLLVDLPGQGFSTALPPSQSTTAGFAQALEALLQRLDFRPDAIVGHSAGAAVALRLALGDAHRDVPVFAINGALAPLGGAAGRMFAPLARLVAERDLVVRMVARRAERPGAVARLLRGTGSQCSQEDLALYRRLLVSEPHVAGTFRMMANWDLPALASTLAAHRAPIHLVEAGNDLTLRPEYRAAVRRLLPHATVTSLPALGHLAHEEAPEDIASIARAWLDGCPGRGGPGACGTVSERVGAAAVSDPGTGGEAGNSAGCPEGIERS